MKKYILILTILSTISLVGCGHEHTFSEATCTDPKICTECGETEGEKLSHNFLEATCESPKKCSLCNLTEGEPLEHQWLEATIENPKTCKLCGLTEGEPLPVEEPEVKEEETTKAEEEVYQALKDAGIDISTYTEQELAIILDILEKQEPVNPNKHTPVDDSAYGTWGTTESTDPDNVMGYSSDPRLQGGTME